MGRRDFKAALKQIQNARKAHGPHARFDELRAQVDRARAGADQATSAPMAPVASAARPSKRWILALAGGALVAAVGSGVMLRNRLTKAPASVRLEVQASAPSAVIQVADQSCTTGDCKFDLKPGAYRIQVSADGYETKTEEATLLPATAPARSRSLSSRSVPRFRSRPISRRAKLPWMGPREDVFRMGNLSWRVSRAASTNSGSQGRTARPRCPFKRTSRSYRPWAGWLRTALTRSH